MALFQASSGGSQEVADFGTPINILNDYASDYYSAPKDGYLSVSMQSTATGYLYVNVTDATKTDNDSHRFVVIVNENYRNIILFIKKGMCMKIRSDNVNGNHSAYFYSI